MFKSSISCLFAVSGLEKTYSNVSNQKLGFLSLFFGMKYAQFIMFIDDGVLLHSVNAGYVWMIEISWLSLTMSTRRNGISKHQRAEKFCGEGPNWILIAGGALLSTLSIRFGYKLKQTLELKPQLNVSAGLKGAYFIAVLLNMFYNLVVNFLS